jgi:hypothetical protein
MQVCIYFQFIQVPDLFRRKQSNLRNKQVDLAYHNASLVHPSVSSEALDISLVLGTSATILLPAIHIPQAWNSNASATYSNIAVYMGRCQS